MSLLVVALAASVVPASAPAVSGTDTLFTIAGTSPGYSGEGGQATSAQLNAPYGVAVDAAGGVYVADENNHRVRRISPGGIIDSVAGTGAGGYSGDGGQATSAQLSRPRDVEVDASGNVFVADSFNHRIRKISSTGVITTVAGTGVSGYAGDGGPATAARLSFPRGIALDADGNLLIADRTNARIRRVDANGTITTVAGTGLAGSSGDGGPATAAALDFPSDVAIDNAGNFYVADMGNDKIRKIDANGVITTIAGTGVSGFSADGRPAVAARLDDPVRVAVDAAANLYIADFSNHRIRKVTPAGVITTVAGTGVAGSSGDGGQATSAQVNLPTGLDVRSDGSLVFTDLANWSCPSDPERASERGIRHDAEGRGVVTHSHVRRLGLERLERLDRQL
ncbi:MAG: NHL repeat-containing protein [Solirubrobacteraceae bacterium]